MRFEVLFGPEDNKQKITEKLSITLGRGAKNDIPFAYAGKVSGKHAAIEKEENRYYITDTGTYGEGSANGTAILNKKIEIWKGNDRPPFPGEKVLIEPGDIIILGRSIWLKFLGD